MGGSIDDPPDWDSLKNINPHDLEDATVDQVSNNVIIPN